MITHLDPIEPRVLFIQKRSEQYGTTYADPAAGHGAQISNGLFNSIQFLADLLNTNGIVADGVCVVDNNSISREVKIFNPTHVFIEALWVVPEKFDILHEIYPDIQWIVRLHSEIPFLSNEGIAMDWINRYLGYKNVTIAANSEVTAEDIRHIIHAHHPDWTEEQIAERLVLLPNYYPTVSVPAKRHKKSDALNIGCFGAIRPLKNQLIQAVAAIRYADQTGQRLYFHMNGGREEQGGNNNLKNIRSLFTGTRHLLVEHPWLDHEEFLELLKSMTATMCVSFTESFCIVAADAIDLGVPTVTSSEIDWSSIDCQAQTTSLKSIVKVLGRVLNPFWRSFLVRKNQSGLRNYCKRSRTLWLKFFKG